MPLPPLFAEVPAELAPAFDPQRPWEILGEGLDRIFDSLPSSRLESRPPPDATIVGDRVVIGRGVRIGAGVVIEGPVRLGDGVELRPGAYVRGGCWVGDGCVIGANTELKRVILLAGAKAPHLSYLGDSMVGAAANLGAGTVLSNFRHDGAEIEVPFGDGRIATGRRKLGAILGDAVKTGCNCVLSPGVIVGRDTQIYAGVVLRPGVYPERSIVKLRQEQIVVPRRS